MSINSKPYTFTFFFLFFTSQSFQTLISSPRRFSAMLARHLCNSAASDFSDNQSEMPKSTDSYHASSSSSSSLSSARYKEIWNCLWISLLISLSKDAKVQSIVLPFEDFRIQSPRLASCPASNPNLYFRPVIGILSHPGDGSSGRLNNESNASYIAASYVKFVEAAGARVIPLIYNEPPEILAEQILEKNVAGDHFPLYAICLGCELLNMIISQLLRFQDNDILEKFSATDQASTVQFIRNTKN